MSETANIVPKRTRESTSKVRTGCSTCKSRRVKCDEAKPVCRRCAVGGRQCHYNVSTMPRSRNVITIYLPTIQSQPTLHANDRHLDFFRQHLAGKLDDFSSEFWSRLVMQLSHSEPCIRHAVSAISGFYREIETSLQHPADYVDASVEAQQDWNKALRCLTTRIQTHPNSNLVPLACCLLFTCIEFLRGNVESSMIHAQSGLNILASVYLDRDGSLDLESRTSASELDDIEAHILPTFSRLGLLCSLAGQIPPPIYNVADKRELHHQNLGDTRQRFVETADVCLRFIYRAIAKAYKFEIDVDDLVEQISLQSRLDRWFEQMNALLDRMRAAGDPVNEDAVHLLVVQYKVIYIWLRTTITPLETTADLYHTEFKELVYHAEQTRRPEVDATTPDLLSFDIQLLGPLYFAVLKCRYPETRRRALEILKWVPRRECFWNAHYAFVTARRIIELEEMHLDAQGMPVEEARVHDFPLPGEVCRSMNMDEVSYDAGQPEQSVTSGPLGTDTLKAEFRTKPWGPAGEWRTVIEYITL